MGEGFECAVEWGPVPAGQMVSLEKCSLELRQGSRCPNRHRPLPLLPEEPTLNQDGHMTEKATYVRSLLNGSWRVPPTLSLELRLLRLLRGRVGRCIDIGMILLSRLLR